MLLRFQFRISVVVLVLALVTDGTGQHAVTGIKLHHTIGQTDIPVFLFIENTDYGY